VPFYGMPIPGGRHDRKLERRLGAAAVRIGPQQHLILTQAAGVEGDEGPRPRTSLVGASIGSAGSFARARSISGSAVL
jgi:hypothetical protein